MTPDDEKFLAEIDSWVADRRHQDPRSKGIRRLIAMVRERDEKDRQRLERMEKQLFELPNYIARISSLERALRDVRDLVLDACDKLRDMDCDEELVCAAREKIKEVLDA